MTRTRSAISGIEVRSCALMAALQATEWSRSSTASGINLTFAFQQFAGGLLHGAGDLFQRKHCRDLTDKDRAAAKVFNQKTIFSNSARFERAASYS